MTAMHASGKSDEGVVPMTHRRPTGRGTGEGRPETSGNPEELPQAETQSLESLVSGTNWIREAARKDQGLRFTNLMHHLSRVSLEESYRCLKRDAAPGVDSVTWHEYGEELSPRITELHRRVQGGEYRAQPSKRAWIAKANGDMRPLGIAALEDKIVQRAMVDVLNAIYEEDFVNFSYGFRPGRSQHKALDALWVGITQRKVSWIVDADIRSFFDTIDHGRLMKFVEYRVADQRILGLLRQWLRAGVSENGRWTGTTVGTPQGAVISPLLANIYLHYVLDLWVNCWRSRGDTGETIIVRYADDFVVGFQNKCDAERFLHDLRERLAQHRLDLHPDKTRLIEFGRYAIANRTKRGDGKPETFNFLGFTHQCAKRRSDGGFTVIRASMAKRMGATLKRIGQSLMKHRSLPLPEQGKRVGAIVRGWLNYHAVPGNSMAIRSFRDRVIEAWRRALRRRSQTADRGTTWEVMRKLAKRFIPPATILHPYPDQRLRVPA